MSLITTKLSTWSSVYLDWVCL